MRQFFTVTAVTILALGVAPSCVVAQGPRAAGLHAGSAARIADVPGGGAQAAASHRDLGNSDSVGMSADVDFHAKSTLAIVATRHVAASADPKGCAPHGTHVDGGVVAAALPVER